LNELLYDLTLDSYELKRKIREYKKKFFTIDEEPTLQTERAEILYLIKTQLYSEETSDIDVISQIADEFQLDPFSAHEETILVNSRRLFKECHPDKKKGQISRFDYLKEGQEIMKLFVEERNNKHKERYNSMYPVLYTGE